MFEVEPYLHCEPFPVMQMEMFAFGDGSRRCPSCKRWLEQESFGQHAWCRDCRRKEQRWAWYGLTDTFIDHLLWMQGGRCAHCGELVPRDEVEVDHWHLRPLHPGEDTVQYAKWERKKLRRMDPREKRKLVRGLLCKPCNSRVIAVADRFLVVPEEMARAMRYSRDGVPGVQEYLSSVPDSATWLN